jgi:membrane protein DedA with SNARE-associated domain
MDDSCAAFFYNVVEECAPGSQEPGQPGYLPEVPSIPGIPEGIPYAGIRLVTLQRPADRRTRSGLCSSRAREPGRQRLVSIGHLIASYGYWALFALVAAESLGIPLPGETALIIAGTYAGTTHHLNPWAIFAVAAAAAIIGDNIGFWIGDKGGYRLARRYGPKVRLDERKLKTARYLFDRQGGKVVFLGRFVSVLRTYAAFLAGTSRMRWRKFLPANASGGITWAGIYTLAAYLAGNALQRASGTIAWALGAAAVAGIIAALLLVRRQASRLADRAEEAYPGPLDSPQGHQAAPSAPATRR